MVHDGNKDEAEKCFNLAQKHFKEGSREKAARFAQKAERLYPSAKSQGEAARVGRDSGLWLLAPQILPYILLICPQGGPWVALSGVNIREKVRGRSSVSVRIIPLESLVLGRELLLTYLASWASAGQACSRVSSLPTA